MSALLTSLASLALALAPAADTTVPDAPAPAPESALAPAPQAVRTIATGRYVEARTASVYAGACHFNGEYELRGREAVLGWSYESGRWNDVDLAGVRVVAVIAGDGNLARAGTRCRTVLYVDAAAPLAARDAVVELLLERHGDRLGKVLDVETVPVKLVFEEDGYRLEVPEVTRLAGEALPDRECCKMPFNVWYDPLVPLDEPVVGCSEVFEHEDDRPGPVWSTEGENNAFLGTFRVLEQPTP